MKKKVKEQILNFEYCELSDTTVLQNLDLLEIPYIDFTIVFAKAISMKERKYYKRPFRCKIHNFSWVRGATSSCRHFIQKYIIMQGRHISAAILYSKNLIYQPLTIQICNLDYRASLLLVER